VSSIPCRNLIRSSLPDESTHVRARRFRSRIVTLVFVPPVVAVFRRCRRKRFHSAGGIGRFRAGGEWNAVWVSQSGQEGPGANKLKQMSNNQAGETNGKFRVTVRMITECLRVPRKTSPLRIAQSRKQKEGAASCAPYNCELLLFWRVAADSFRPGATTGFRNGIIRAAVSGRSASICCCCSAFAGAPGNSSRPFSFSSIPGSWQSCHRGWPGKKFLLQFLRASAA